MQESISALRFQLSSSQTGETVQQLRSDRDELAQEVQHLRVQLGAAQSIRRKQLTKLTIQSNNAAKKLQETVALVNLIHPHLLFTYFHTTKHILFLFFQTTALSLQVMVAVILPSKTFLEQHLVLILKQNSCPKTLS